MARTSSLRDRAVSGLVVFVAEAIVALGAIALALIVALVVVVLV